jgi:hypothetical protein
MDLINKTFFPRHTSLYDKVPYVSIILFILAVVLKTIQRLSNDKNYLQNIVLGKTQTPRKTQSDPVSALFLNYLDTMGVNSFFDTSNNPLAISIVMVLIGYPLLALIEMNVGHALIGYFILVLIFYVSFAGGFQNLVCQNNTSTISKLSNSTYCCGSFIFWATIGCFLSILFMNANRWTTKLIILAIILLVWGGIILYEYFGTYVDESNQDLRTCNTFFWHGMNFAFGVLSGIVMANNRCHFIRL